MLLENIVIKGENDGSQHSLPFTAVKGENNNDLHLLHFQNFLPQQKGASTSLNLASVHDFSMT